MIYVIPGVLKNRTITNNNFYSIKVQTNSLDLRRGWFLIEKKDAKSPNRIIDFIPSYDKPLPNLMKSRYHMTTDEFQHYNIE